MKQYKEEGGTVHKKKNTGKAPLLTMAEKLALGGWCIKQLRRNRGLSQDRVIAQVWKMFGVTVSDAWLSSTMHGMGFVSKIVRSTEYERETPSNVESVASFLSDIRGMIAENYTPERVVCMDVMAMLEYWGCAPLLCC